MIWDGKFRDVTDQELSDLGLNPFAVHLLVESPVFKAVPIVPFRLEHRGEMYEIMVRKMGIPPEMLDEGLARSGLAAKLEDKT